MLVQLNVMQTTFNISKCKADLRGAGLRVVAEHEAEVDVEELAASRDAEVLQVPAKNDCFTKCNEQKRNEL